MKPPSIEVRNLTKRYGKTKAINNISFSIEDGEIIGFLGPNGAGKSTTMRILAGLSTGTSGSAFIHGISLANNPSEAQRLVGFMPENNPLPEQARVIEYLRHRAKIKGIPAKQQRNRIDTVMDIAELSRSAERKIIGNLSKGFRQRVGIADCLLAKPRVIIMDEPTIGLDPHQILSIRKLINSLRGKMTVLISSHILPEIESYCDRNIIINRGQIVTEGDHQTLRERYTPYDTYHITASGNFEAIKVALLDLDSEMRISEATEAEAGAIRFETKSAPERCNSTRIIEAITKNPSWKLHAISREEPSLEDIFIAATRPSWNPASEESLKNLKAS